MNSTKPVALDLNAKLLEGLAVYYRVKYKAGKTDFYSGIVLLDKEASKEFHVYPNPASDQITLDVPDMVGITLVDILGRTVLARDVRSGFQLSVKDLPNGYYLIRVNFEDLSTKTFRISVVH